MSRKKKLNWNGSSRRENKATPWCPQWNVLSHWPLGCARQRWTIKVTLAEAQWSVSLILSSHDNIDSSEGCTFTCHPEKILTLVYTARKGW
jgi:hypothetical protein